jgi:hypothetical protein
MNHVQIMCWGQAFNVYVTAHLCGVNHLKIHNPIEAASTTLRVSAYHPNSISFPKLGTSYPCCHYICHDQKCRFLEYLDHRDQSLLLTSGQSLWISSFFFYAASTLVKVSIVLFYKRIFTAPKFQIAAWTMIALLIIWGIGISLVKLRNVHQSLRTNYVT